MIDPVTLANIFLIALAIWRESRGASLDAMKAVAFSIRNRVQHPSWWGKDWHTVITAHEQYSCFNSTDPQVTKFPVPTDPQWQEAVTIAKLVYNDNNAQSSIPDPTDGCTHYYDKTLDANPPAWAKSTEMVHVCDIGPFHCYRPTYLGVPA